jgi:hypothetical protein
VLAAAVVALALVVIGAALWISFATGGAIGHLMNH